VAGAQPLRGIDPPARFTESAFKPLKHYGLELHKLWMASTTYLVRFDLLQPELLHLEPALSGFWVPRLQCQLSTLGSLGVKVFGFWIAHGVCGINKHPEVAQARMSRCCWPRPPPVH
jgi:hypothetical protein